MGFGVINEQGFPFEDSNAGYKNLTEQEMKTIERSSNAPEKPSEEPENK